MKYFILLLFVVLFFPLNSLGLFQTGQNVGNYVTYTNARYDYSISYPEKILIAQGESDNGDGQRFVSKDNQAEMVVYGSIENKEIQNTLKGIYLEEITTDPKEHPNKKVTYKVLKNSMFVVSGYENNKVFYRKTMLVSGKGCDVATLITFRIEYNKEQKQLYDRITEKVASSLNPGSCQ